MYSCLGNSLPKEREGMREGSLGNVGHAKASDAQEAGRMEMRKHVGQCNLISNICTSSKIKDQVPQKSQSLLVITGVIQKILTILKGRNIAYLICMFTFHIS